MLDKDFKEFLLASERHCKKEIPMLEAELAEVNDAETHNFKEVEENKIARLHQSISFHKHLLVETTKILNE